MSLPEPNAQRNLPASPGASPVDAFGAAPAAEQVALQADHGPLSWVLGEIRAALTLSSGALQEAAELAGEARAAALARSKAFLHQAHGALLMLEIEGVAMVSGAAETLYGQIAQGLVVLTPELAGRVDLSYEALYEYLDELLAGAAPQPVRLFPYYRNLLEAMGADRIHPADLFFADLQAPTASTSPPVPAFEGGVDERAFGLVRQRFEKSLLKFLKTADPADALPMAQVSAILSRTRAAPAARAFWWVLHGFTDAIATGHLGNDMLTKQLFGRINKHLRKVAEDADATSSDILRDALFYCARVARPRGLQQAIRQAFKVDALVPADFEKQRYGLVDVGALNIARERLGHAKVLWARVVHGDLSVVTAFEQDMDGLDAACAKLNSAPLGRLLEQIKLVARKLMHGRPDEASGLEIATALLVVESALQDIRRLPEYFAERTDAMTERLRLLGAGRAPAAAPPPEQLDHGARQAQQQAMSTLAAQMQSGLLEVERILDDYFREDTEATSLLDVAPLLQQIEGAMAILEQEAAVRALRHARLVVTGFSASAPRPPQEVCENLAQNIGALGLFMDALRLNPAEARRRYDFDLERNVFGRVVEKPAPAAAAQEHEAAAQEHEPAAQEHEPAAQAQAAAQPPELLPEFDPADLVRPLSSMPQFHHAGSLPIPFQLYRIFQVESGELLELLQRELQDWRREPGRAVDTRAVHAAHSLAGSSATVGLVALTELASAVEAVLQQQAGGHARAPARPMAAWEFDILDEGIERLGSMLAEVADGREPQSDPPTLQSLQRVLRELVAFATEPAAAADLQGAEAGQELVDVGGAAGQSGASVPQALLVDAFMSSRFEADSQGLQDVPDADLLPVFVEEARDIMPQLGRELREWRRRPEDSGLAKSLMRLTHTLKGSARMAGAMRLGQHMHHMEARIENCQHVHPLSPQIFDELLQMYDRSVLLFEELLNIESAMPAEAREAPAHAADAAFAADSAAAGSASNAGGMAGAGAAANTASNAAAGIAANTGANAAAGAASNPSTRSSTAPVALPAAGAALVRVRADILDRLANQAGEVSISRSRLETEVGSLRQSLAELSENVLRLRRHLREVEFQADARIASRPALEAAAQLTGQENFDALEFDRYTRLQELTRMMAESVDDVSTVQQTLSSSLASASSDLVAQARMTRDLQQDLMRVRMVQFASLSDRLYRVVRQTAKENGKRVNLDIRGAGLEVDRSVLDRMAGPFEHLLRNAIVHGIEPEAQRRAAGKRETGDLTLEVRQEGNEVVLQFADDGAGLDFSAIRRRAVAEGLMAEDDLVSEAELADMIFYSGFTTAQELTESAGRGVGMDVVRAEAAGLGGVVSIHSTRGAGMRVTIRLPLTLAVTQVVLLNCGERLYAMPSVLIEQVVQLKAEAFAIAERDGAVQWQGQRVEMVYLGRLLAQRMAAPLERAYAPVVILRNGSQRVAVHVDEIVGNREVVVKNTGPQLARVTGISGATVLGSGDIVVIINPLQLAARNAPRMVESAAAPKAALPLVMVVDDSLTVRRVTQRMLAREGFDVVLAKDGVDALERVQEVLPDLMLVDIEMPRMDGFDLLRSLRGDPRTASIPVIIITSRTASKHRTIAEGLGISAYFGKPYQEAALLESIRSVLDAGRE